MPSACLVVQKATVWILNNWLPCFHWLLATGETGNVRQMKVKQPWFERRSSWTCFRLAYWEMLILTTSADKESIVLWGRFGRVGDEKSPFRFLQPELKIWIEFHPFILIKWIIDKQGLPFILQLYLYEINEVKALVMVDNRLWLLGQYMNVVLESQGPAMQHYLLPWTWGRTFVKPMGQLDQHRSSSLSSPRHPIHDHWASV